MKKVLLYGQSSYDNRGCEALAYTTSSQIKKTKKYTISCATFDYLNNQKFHNNLIDKYINHYYKEKELKGGYKKLNDYYKTIPFDYMNFEKLYQHDVIDEIKDSDICLSIGGDNYCYGYNEWLYAISDEIRKQNKKNVLWCSSLFEEITDPELINNLRSFDVVMARESLTYKALEKIVDKDRLMKAVDPAFSLKPKKVRLPKIFNNKVIGINVSPLVIKDENKLNSIIELVKYILSHTDSSIALIPHVYIEGNNDLDDLSVIKDRFSDEKRVEIINEKKYDCMELKYIISNCEFLVAARTHASIAAYSSCVPTLVIGYSVKSKGLAKDLFGNYDDYVISYDILNPVVLIDKFKRLYNDKNKIKNKLAKQMPELISKSSEMFNLLTLKLKELEEKKVTIESYCTGCRACMNVCPTNAITMKKNKEGFMYPYIDLNKCIKCGLCRKTCPINNNTKYEYDNHVYGVYNKSKKYDKHSSSGAVFPALAEAIFKDNGIVYGCFLEKSAKHIRIENINDLNKILGSKYIQSDTGFTFKDVKNDLKNNISVLYAGTPCQIAGLKRFLDKEYDNLYTVSFICHGVPNQNTFDLFLKETFKNNINNINFRYKHNNKTTNVCYENDDFKIINDFENDMYINLFEKNFSLRQACFNCEFKLGKKNVSDIILGDFWGIENYKDNIKRPCSVVITNSLKGQKLFEQVKNKLEYFDTTVDDVYRYNPSLINKIPTNYPREIFFNNINTKGFISACELALEENSKSLAYNSLKQNDTLKEKVGYQEGIITQLTKELNDMMLLKEKYESELNQIKNSKRWKIVDKIVNITKKIGGSKDV